MSGLVRQAARSRGALRTAAPKYKARRISTCSPFHSPHRRATRAPTLRLRDRPQWYQSVSPREPGRRCGQRTIFAADPAAVAQLFDAPKEPRIVDLADV